MVLNRSRPSETEFRTQPTALDVWQSRLLQLDKRNNLLHFNERSKGAVRLSCADVDTFHTALTDSGDSGLCFAHLVKNKDTSEMEAKTGDLEATNCDVRDLQKRLTVLRRRDREWEEEQGTNVLFVTFGLIDWSDPFGASGTAPLVMQPADLLQESPRQPYFLARESDDPALNTTIKHFLDKLGCVLPEFKTDIPISEYLADCRRVAETFGFVVRDQVYLSCFAYSKLGLWNDIQQIKQQGATHPVLQALLGDSQSALWNSSTHTAPTETALHGGRLDDLLNAREKHLILPADSSQCLAAHFAQAGEHLIIHGPPGTGKSQTIANLIGMLLSDGKSVLFVSEKTAALDVVKRRLDKAGLGVFCLDLHSERGKSAQVYEQLAESLCFEEDKRTEFFAANRHKNLQSHLNATCQALHEKRGILQLSVFDAAGRLSILRDIPSLQEGFSNGPVRFDDISISTKAMVVALCGRIANHEKEFYEGENSFWKGRLRTNQSTIGISDNLRDKAGQLLSLVSKLRHLSAELANILKQAKPGTSNELDRLLLIVPLITNPAWESSVPFEWASRDLEKTYTLLENRYALFANKRTATERLGPLRDILKRMDSPELLFRSIKLLKSMAGEATPMFGNNWPDVYLTKQVQIRKRVAITLTKLSEALENISQFESLFGRFLALASEGSVNSKLTGLVPYLSPEFTNAIEKYLSTLKDCATFFSSGADFLEQTDLVDLNKKLSSIKNAGEDFLRNADFLRDCIAQSHALLGFLPREHSVEHYLQFVSWLKNVQRISIRCWLNEDSKRIQQYLAKWSEASAESTKLVKEFSKLSDLGLLDLFGEEALHSLLSIQRQGSKIFNARYRRAKSLIQLNSRTHVKVTHLATEGILKQLQAIKHSQAREDDLLIRLASLESIYPLNREQLSLLATEVNELPCHIERLPFDALAIRRTLSTPFGQSKLSLNADLIARATEKTSNSFHTLSATLSEAKLKLALVELLHHMQAVKNLISSIDGPINCVGPLLKYTQDLEEISRILSIEHELVQVEEAIATNSSQLSCSTSTEFDMRKIEKSFAWVRLLKSTKINLSLEQIFHLHWSQRAKLEHLFKEISDAKLQIRRRTRQLSQFVSLPWRSDKEPTFIEVESWLNQLIALAPSAGSFIHYLNAKDNLENLVRFPVVRLARELIDDPALLFNVIEKRILTLWLDWIISTAPVLRDYKFEDIEKASKAFEELDRTGIAERASREIRARLFKKYPGKYARSCDVGETATIVNEIRKYRKRLPIRSLLDRAPSIIRRLKPCFMMSPLAVSQILPFSKERDSLFDVLIFDEASQIFPEDAIPAISRCHQIIAVGDEQQLPPTSFFNRTTESSEEEVELDNIESSTTSTESILGTLKLLAGRGIRESHLNMHYRSRDESLIAFSNQHFYYNKLLTFPGPKIDGERDGIVDFYLNDGIYDQGATKTNQKEALKICDLVFRHFENYGLTRSIGVVALSRAQSDYIHEVIEERRKELPEFDSFFSEDLLEPFFVKNLENVQGDERDHIILSIGFGPSEVGRKVMNNFGPIINPGGERRLNVAISRARYTLIMVRSLTPNDISSHKKGAQLLKEFISYCELRGQRSANLSAELSGIQEDMVKDLQYRLEQRGLVVHHYNKEKDKPLDLAIVAKDKSRYELGIVVDGKSHFNAHTARDREWLRTAVLKQLGWKIVTVRAMNWLVAPEREYEKIASQLHPEQRADLTEPTTLKVELPGAPVNDEVSFSDRIRTSTANAIQLFEEYTYSTWSARGLSTSQISDSHIRAAVMKIAEAEGPIHLEDVFERLREVFGLGRLSSKFRERTYSAVEHLKKEERLSLSKDIQKVANFIWRGDESTKRPRRARSGEAVRKIERIAITEIRAGILIVVGELGSVHEDELVREVARQFGFSRITSEILDRIEKVFRKILSQGDLVVQERMVTTNEGYSNSRRKGLS